VSRSAYRHIFTEHFISPNQRNPSSLLYYAVTRITRSYQQ